MASLKSFTVVVLALAAQFSTVLSQTCIPRPAKALVLDPSLEAEDSGWGGRGNPVLSEPTYPAHTGSKSMALISSYSPGANNYSYMHYFVGDARTGITYDFEAFYNVISYTKGSECPDPNLPLASCNLLIDYTEQTFATIPLSLTGGYLSFATPFVPLTSGRHLQLTVNCLPATAEPQCAEITVLFDDIKFSDAGQTCGWEPVGCVTDSTSARTLDFHGTIPGWPATTTIEKCQAACQTDGFVYAGLEFGNECWCGNELTGSTAASGCSMPCSGDVEQICGGPDRLSVYHRTV